MDVFDSPSPVPHPRVGVIVPKYRHTVVERNLVRRRIREILRTEVMPRLQGNGNNRDVLVRARREAYGASYAEFRDELLKWTERRCSPAPSS
jgi:ribonuclease P protein component